MLGYHIIIRFINSIDIFRGIINNVGRNGTPEAIFRGGYYLPGLVNIQKTMEISTILLKGFYPLFRLGHFQVRKLWMFTRRYIGNHPRNRYFFQWIKPLLSHIFFVAASWLPGSVLTYSLERQHPLFQSVTLATNMKKLNIYINPYIYYIDINPY